MKRKSILLEIAILAGLFLFVLFMMMVIMSNISLDIPLHDTYFVEGRRIMVLTPFLIIALIVYLVKETRYRFKRQLQNWITLVLNFCLVLRLISLVLFAGQLPNNPSGWTVYPPLSALPKAQPDPLSAGGLNHFLTIKVILLVVTAFFIITLVFISMMTGRNSNKKTHV